MGLLSQCRVLGDVQQVTPVVQWITSYTHRVNVMGSNLRTYGDLYS